MDKYLYTSWSLTADRSHCIQQIIYKLYLYRLYISRSFVVLSGYLLAAPTSPILQYECPAYPSLDLSGTYNLYMHTGGFGFIRTNPVATSWLALGFGNKSPAS